MLKVALFKNFSWLLLDKIIRIVGGLAVGIWLARYLGPHDFGIINYATAFIAFFVFLPNLGLDQIVVRELSKNPESYNKLLGTAFLMKLLGACIALSLIFFISIITLQNEPLTQLVIWVIALSYLFQAFDVIDFYYQAKILSKYVVIGRDLAFIISSIIKIVFILNHYELIYFVWITVLDVALSAVFFVIIYQKLNQSISHWRFDFLVVKELLTYSWPLMLSSFLITIHTNVDQIMIEHFLDKTEVGVYAAALRLSNCWLFVPSIIVSTLLPYYVKLRQQNPLSYQENLIRLYSFMFWIGTFVSIVTFVFGERIILLLYGEAYGDAYQALVLNIWSGIFISQAVARGIWMVSENLQTYRLYNNIIAVIINIAGNIILIPKYGISGAAFSTLMTQMLGTWLMPFLWKPLRKSNIDLLKSMNPYFLLRNYV